MDLRPPFPADLTPEDEIARFERLKPRLEEVWQALVDRDEEPYTSVVVPSLTLDQSELRKLPGASFYEERLLFLLIRLRNPRARMVFVTSQPVHGFVLEYYFQFLAGIPASHARARLTLLCAYDASPRSLTESYPDDASDLRLHLTSDYTLMGPLRYHLYRQVRLRAAAHGVALPLDEREMVQAASLPPAGPPRG